MKTQLLTVIAFVLGVGSLNAFQDVPSSGGKFGVKIQDEKAVVVNVEGSGAIDPTQRIRFMSPSTPCRVNSCTSAISPTS